MQEPYKTINALLSEGQNITHLMRVSSVDETHELAIAELTARPISIALTYGSGATTTMTLTWTALPCDSADESWAWACVTMFTDVAVDQHTKLFVGTLQAAHPEWFEAKTWLTFFVSKPLGDTPQCIRPMMMLIQ